MNAGRTEFDLGEVFRRYGKAYEYNHPMSLEQRKALHDLSRCRTSILGGHIDRCPNCNYERPAYNSCGNRNCPKCQGIKKHRWIKERLEEVLPVQYFHTIFTIAQEYHVFAKYSAVHIYRAIFAAASKVVLRQMKKQYGVVPGIIFVLHTWGQKLQIHPHIHMLITGGGLNIDKTKWIHCPPRYLINVVNLQEAFKKQFAREMIKLQKNNKLRCNSDRRQVPTIEQVEKINNIACAKRWNVHIHKPFSGPKKVIEYIGRYTHCVAILNSRIKHISADGNISIDCKNYRKRDRSGIPKHEIISMTPDQLIGSFMTHVLPKRFRKIRMYGIYGGSNRKEKIEKCKSLFPVGSDEEVVEEDKDNPPADMQCPVCKTGIMEWTNIQLKPERSPPFIYDCYRDAKQMKKAV